MGWKKQAFGYTANGSLNWANFPERQFGNFTKSHKHKPFRGEVRNVLLGIYPKK